MRRLFVLLALLACACASRTPAVVGSPEAITFAARSVQRSSAHVLVGAGDIANCGPDLANAKATAAIIEAMPEATVFTAGDNAYMSGTDANYADCYEPTWGTFKARTKPSPGNHEYRTPGAAGYFRYFAGVPHDYSFDLGEWHVVSLDSDDGKPPGAAQLRWLENDLAANTKPCIAAIWHHPRFSSGEHGNNARMRPYWLLLVQHGADVIVNGHDHNYERFAPQDFDGRATPAGIRQFVVGTGGRDLRSLGTRRANSDFFDARMYGVLALTLHAASYEWAFIGTDGAVHDASSAPQPCH